MRQNKTRLAAVTGIMISTALASSAGAAVIFFPGQEIPIPINYAGVSVDLETGATSSDLEGAADMDMNFFLGGIGITNDADENSTAPTWQPVRIAANNDSPVDNLTIGTTVDASSVTALNFGGSGGTTSHFTPFVSGSSGYIGFALETAGPTTVYGWVRVTLQDDNTPGVIHEWGYEDTGAPIIVGAIPEPSHSLLTLLGLATLALRRRR